MGRRPPGPDSAWGIEVQRPEGQVIPVAPQIRHGAVPEIPPTIPLRPGKINIVVGSPWSRPQPKVPIQVLWHRALARRSFGTPDNIAVGLCLSLGLPAPRSRNPHMHFADLTNGTGLHQFHHTTVVVSCMDLSAHLSGHPGLGGRFGDHARFIHIAG